MKASLPSIEGPRQAVESDIDELNRVFSSAFTDRYRRDGLLGVRVPQLNADIWRYAITDARDGAQVWEDAKGRLVAFNIAHLSGGEGWMGPLAVRTDSQGRGLGKAIVGSAVEWLKERDAMTIGLETMPRTVDNIGFYSSLDFVPGHLTVSMTGPASTTSREYGLLSALSPEERAAAVDGCAAVLAKVAPRVDFTREIELTMELGVGDTILLEESETLAGYALVHYAPLAHSRKADELRVLKIAAQSIEGLANLLDAVGDYGISVGLEQVTIRCQTSQYEAYRLLIDRGYEVRWTDLRMTLRGFPEGRVADGAVMMSNWEI